MLKYIYKNKFLANKTRIKSNKTADWVGVIEMTKRGKLKVTYKKYYNLSDISNQQEKDGSLASFDDYVKSRGIELDGNDE